MFNLPQKIIWNRIFSLLRPYRGQLASQVTVAILLVILEALGLGVVLMLLGAGAMSGGSLPNIPWLAELMQSLAALSASARIRLAALLLILITGGRSGLQYLQSLQGLQLRRRVERDLQLELLGRLHQLTLSFIQREHAGGMLTVVGQYPRQVGQLIFSFSQVIVYLVVLAAYTGLALWLSWPLTLLTGLLLLPGALILRPLLSRRLRAASHEMYRVAKALHSLLQENLAAMKIIQLYHRTEWSLARASQGVEALHAAEYRVGMIGELNRPIFTMFNTLALALILLAASFLLVGRRRHFWLN
jgi:ATP-binding cassette, subfamily B, multidrug efflux pump